MKKIFSLLLSLGILTSVTASGVELVVEAIDNNGMVPGNTYRVYLVLPDAQQSLHAVFADDQSDLSVTTTGSFYQNPFGNYSTLDINSNVIELEPSLAYDSWVTIGAENSQNNNLWNIGVDFNSFLEGGALTIDDGAWFLIPTDVRTIPDEGNKILLMQLTTDGIASGNLNFQGWDANGEVWQARDVTFTTENAQVFGCTDSTAPNFNAEATFDDGTCQESTPNNNNNNPANSLSSLDQAGSWQVFPNPIWEDQFNLQFSERLELDEGNLVIEIFDGSGKLVHAEEINAGQVIGGNKVIVKKSLAAGTYTVSIAHNSFSDTAQIIVQR